MFLAVAVPLAVRPHRRATCGWESGAAGRVVRGRLAHDQIPGRRRLRRAVLLGARTNAGAAAADVGATGGGRRACWPARLPVDHATRAAATACLCRSGRMARARSRGRAGARRNGPRNSAGSASTWRRSLRAAWLTFSSSTVREAVAAGVAPRLQLRVIAGVWLVDACFAPLGLRLAYAAQSSPPLLSADAAADRTAAGSRSGPQRADRRGPPSAWGRRATANPAPIRRLSVRRRVRGQTRPGGTDRRRPRRLDRRARRVRRPADLGSAGGATDHEVLRTA